MRLLEVLAGQASVALENARLYEQQRREAEGAKALLAFADGCLARTRSRRSGHYGVAGGDALFETSRRLDLAWRRCVAQVRRPDQRRRGGARYAGEGGIGGGSSSASRTWTRTANGSSRRSGIRPRSHCRRRASTDDRRGGRDRERAARGSREFATAESPEEVLGRSVEVTARVLRRERASLWIQEEAEPGDLVGSGLVGYPADIDPALGRRYSAALAHEWLERAEPFVLEPDDVAGIDGVPTPEHRPLRRRSASAGRRPGGRARRDDRRADHRRPAAAGFSPASPTRRSLRSRAPSTSRGSSDVRLDRRDARERTRGERRVHLVARPLDQRHGAARRPCARARPRRAEAPRARRALPRHRQDRDPVRDPAEARPPDGRGVRDREEHPELGEKILAPIDRLADVRPIVRACHERWDGGGYPDGKAGDEIPIEARIVLVCDAFHAMVTDRPYRGRMPDAEAGRTPRRVGRHAVRPDGRRGIRPSLRDRRRAPASLVMYPATFAGFLAREHTARCRVLGLVHSGVMNETASLHRLVLATQERATSPGISHARIFEPPDRADVDEADALQDRVRRAGHRLGDERRRPPGDGIVPARPHERAVDAASARPRCDAARDQEDAAVGVDGSSDAGGASVDGGRGTSRGRGASRRFEFGAQMRSLRSSPVGGCVECFPHHLGRGEVVVERVDATHVDACRAW